MISFLIIKIHYGHCKKSRMYSNHEHERINENIVIYHADCLKMMPLLASDNTKVDLILTDLPYGTTNCKWDSIIDLNSMWKCIDDLISPSTPVLLFAQQPFTTVLGASNMKNLRYNWVWEKTQGTVFLNAKKMPLKCHEDILVFYKNLPVYNPIKTEGHRRKVSLAKHKAGCKKSDIYHECDNHVNYDSTQRYPRSVIKFKSDKQTCALHPTQKPVALLEYLIRTYTNENDTVLDFTMGSGSTGVACSRSNRKFIGIDNDIVSFNVAKNRLLTCKC